MQRNLRFPAQPRGCGKKLTGDHWLLARYQLADRLQKLPGEIASMTEEQFIHMLAYYKLREKTTDGH